MDFKGKGLGCVIGRTVRLKGAGGQFSNTIITLARDTPIRSGPVLGEGGGSGRGRPRLGFCYRPAGRRAPVNAGGQYVWVPQVMCGQNMPTPTHLLSPKPIEKKKLNLKKTIL